MRGLSGVIDLASTPYRALRVRDRRRYGWLLLGAMACSLFANFEASLCMPGMSMGGDMETSDGLAMMDMANGTFSGLHCWAPMSMDGDGEPVCPFSVGGGAPCGTTPPVPVPVAYSVEAFVEATLELPRVVTRLNSAAPRVPTPPPRA